MTGMCRNLGIKDRASFLFLFYYLGTFLSYFCSRFLPLHGKYFFYLLERMSNGWDVSKIGYERSCVFFFYCPRFLPLHGEYFFYLPERMSNGWDVLEFGY